MLHDPYNSVKITMVRFKHQSKLKQKIALKIAEYNH